MTDLVPNLFSFILLTLVCAGAAAFMAGRALAGAWKAPGMTLLYAMPLAGAARFLHFALVGEATSLAGEGAMRAGLAYLLMAAFAMAGFLVRRRAQMARQYPWLRTASS